jgi:hypothetical protein
MDGSAVDGGACRSRLSTVAKEAMRRSYTSRFRLVSVDFCPLAPLFSNLSAESACRPRIGQLSKDVLCFNQHAGSAPSHSKRGRHLHKESSGTFENSVNESSQLSLAHEARLVLWNQSCPQEATDAELMRPWPRRTRSQQRKYKSLVPTIDNIPQ